MKNFYNATNKIDIQYRGKPIIEIEKHLKNHLRDGANSYFLFYLTFEEYLLCSFYHSRDGTFILIPQFYFIFILFFFFVKITAPLSN